MSCESVSGNGSAARDRAGIVVVAAILLGVALAVSCAPFGATSKPAPERLTSGVTTVDRAIVMLGQPTRVSAQPGGEQTLYWQKARATQGRAAGPLAIVFDAHDVMVRTTTYRGP